MARQFGFPVAQDYDGVARGFHELAPLLAQPPLELAACHGSSVIRHDNGVKGHRNQTGLRSHTATPRCPPVCAVQRCEYTEDSNGQSSPDGRWAPHTERMPGEL